jgi:hypothetical protein
VFIIVGLEFEELGVEVGAAGLGRRTVRAVGGRGGLPGDDRADDDHDHDDLGDAMTRRSQGNLQKKGCMTVA